MPRTILALTMSLYIAAYVHVRDAGELDALGNCARAKAEQALGWALRMPVFRAVVGLRNDFSRSTSVPVAPLTGNAAQHRQTRQRMAATVEEGTARNPVNVNAAQRRSPRVNSGNKIGSTSFNQA